MVREKFRSISDEQVEGINSAHRSLPESAECSEF